MENKKFILSNGKQYMVIEHVEYDNHIYVLLNNIENDKEFEFRELIVDGMPRFSKINSELFATKIFDLFLLKLNS